MKGSIGLSLLLVLSVPGCGKEAASPAPVASPPAAETADPSSQPPAAAESRDASGVRAEIVPPRAIESPAPDWNRLPGREPRGNSGTYALRIDETGQVTEVHVVRSADPASDALVIETLRHWRFEPARRDGTAVPVRWQVTVKVGQ